MKNFRRLSLAIALMAGFTMPALAEGGNTQGPTITGETSTAPAPGDGHSPGASITGDGQCPTPSLTGDILSPAWTAVLDLLF